MVKSYLACVLVALWLSLMIVRCPAKEDNTTTIPLWPFYYSAVQPDGSYDREILFSAFTLRKSASGAVSGNIVPVFWGTNYFHVIPLLAME